MNHNTLENYYRTIFAMSQHHKYTISDLENLVVFERDLYVEMLADYLKEVEERQRNG